MIDLLATPPDLAPWVQCIWTLRCAGSADPDPPIAPDGCCEWIVHLGDPPRVWRETEWVRQPRNFVFGQLRGPLRLHNERHTDVLAVRLRAHAATALLRVAGAELIARELPVAELICHVDGRRWLGHFESLGAAYPRMIALLRRLAAVARAVDPLALAATTAIDRSHGLQRIGVLAREARVSTRTLERRFNDAVGLSPKRYARVRRMQHGLQLFSASPLGLAAIADIAGYADQAHMTREFVALAGCRPADIARVR